MQKFKKIKALAGVAAAVMASHAAYAQIAANDLILGFTQAGVSSSEYVIDLGNASTVVGVGGNQQVNLSSSINMSLFNSAFSGGPNGVAMGIVGGNNGTGTKDVFLTVLRTATGNPPSLAGSDTPANTSAAASISLAAAAANSITPLGVQPVSGTTSWSTQVAHGPNDGTQDTPFIQNAGVNPMNFIAGNSIIMDLYHNNRVGSTGQTGFIYDGYFTLTFLDANTETLTFTSAAFVPVPEPGTYGLIAGAGLLALTLRRQFVRSNA